VSKIFQEKNLEILVSQHAEDRGTTARVTHRDKLNPSAKPLESRLILVTICSMEDVGYDGCTPMSQAGWHWIRVNLAS
jgi:hypothetical protein